MIFSKKLSECTISKWFILAAMTVAFFTVCYNTTALINALPVIAAEFHFNIVNLQWMINGYVLVAVSFISLSGKLGDIFDKKKVFVFGASGYILASILIALSWNQFFLIGSRAVQGLFAAFITSSTLTIIKTSFDGNEETLAIGIWAASIGIGNAIGPFIGGFVTTYLGWPYIFLFNLLPMGFSIIITMLMVQGSIRPRQRERIDYSGAFLLIVGLFLLVFALVKGNTWGFTNIKTVAFFISGIIVLSIFKIVEKGKDHAIINFIYLHNKLFLFSSFGIFIAVGCSIGIPYFLNLYLQNSFILGFSPVLAGAALLPFSFSILSTSLLLPKISMKINPYYIVPLALMILAFGLMGLTFSIRTIDYRLILLFLIVSGLGVGLIMPAFPKIALSNFSKQNIGQGSGLVNTIVYFADLLAVVIGNIVFYFFGGRAVLAALKKFSGININEHFLNIILLGDKAAVHYVSGFAAQKKILVQVAQHVVITAFSGLIIAIFIIVIIYSLLCFFFLPKEKLLD